MTNSISRYNHLSRFNLAISDNTIVFRDSRTNDADITMARWEDGATESEMKDFIIYLLSAITLERWLGLLEDDAWMKEAVFTNPTRYHNSVICGTYMAG